MALRWRRIGRIAGLGGRIRRRSRIERRQSRSLLATTATRRRAASARAAPVRRIGALRLAWVALLVLAATRPPLIALIALIALVALVALIALIWIATALRWPLGIALVALACAPTLAARRLLLLATLAALAIWLGRRIGRRRVNGVRLAAALLVAPLRTLPVRVAARRIGLRWALWSRLLRILRLARLAASLDAAMTLRATSARRIRHDTARAGWLRTSCRLL